MRLRWLVLGLLVLDALLIGLGVAQWRRGGDRVDRRSDPRGSVLHEPIGADGERPTLAGGERPTPARGERLPRADLPGSQASAGSGGDVVSQPEWVMAPREEEQPEEHHGLLRLHLLDGDKQPISYSGILAQSASDTSRASANHAGWLSLWLPEGALTQFEITTWWKDGFRSLLRVEHPEDLKRLVSGDVIVVGLRHLVVRTVNTAGDARPDQPFLYRLPGVPEYEAWEDTTDEEGRCRIGPFPASKHLEIRPGPEGESDDDRRKGWQSVLLDGSVFDLRVGDAPRLRVQVDGVPAGEYVHLALLDAESGGRSGSWGNLWGPGVWTAPALAEGRRVDVLVGPTNDGRYARLRNVMPMATPYVVELRPGAPLAGRVAAPDMEFPVEGEVRVSGPAFSESLDVAADGTFRFPGLPDGPAELWAQVKGSKGATYFGAASRTDDRDIQVPVARCMRVEGRFIVLNAAGIPQTIKTRDGFSIRGKSATFPSPPLGDTKLDGSFTIALPPGRWELEGFAWTLEDDLLVGEIDLGDLQAPRDDLVLHLRPLPR